ncbi:hypothetical protein AAZX31_05G223300 [Glycine max]|uniref:Uncharacterized protein n=2 Tax=Glycine subgen. Soja TaxID=1462606 RepID=I1K5L2_SOYBN|nr:hypothetical protein JHK85_014221 [Glycine max]KHN21604.1 hypothetical protein glysoja_023456 [Glycine soja]KAG5058860.1 hypothetical protein JHK86_013856 [Glycine max]KAG5155874.1 hypothetical protein JHK82_013843 [Glycine max]KAH1140789.1 hypothetical protein GYH30_057051 [Glycine max]
MENRTPTPPREGCMGFAVHSQVIKIKEEIEKIKHPSLQLHMRRALLRDVNHLHSRSPLGLADRDRAILRC